jgi:hypothetical protein
MFDFLKKPQEPQPSEDHELQTLETEKRQLTGQIATLSAKARSANYMGDKRTFQKQKAELSKRKNHLETKIDNIREKLALPNTEAICKQNLSRIILTCNGYDIKIDPETLKIVIPFNCTHNKTMSLFEILRHQSTLSSNRALFSTWQALFTNSGVISGAFLCEQCMRHKKKEMQGRGVFSSSMRTGRANWSLKVR